MIIGVTYAFHFQPSEIWEMDLDELHFWCKGIAQVAAWTKGN